VNREFLDLYNRELQLLYEQAKEFAEEYPGVAERLGGLTAETVDPMVAGLLEGTAFLAARVQLKMKHEFPEFTRNLLNQIVPNYLAPTPSVMLVSVIPPYSDPNLRSGRTIARDEYLDATYSERTRRVSCRFRLCADITLWPFEVIGAEYYTTATALLALGLPPESEILSGLRISLTHRMAADREEEISDEDAKDKKDIWFAGCRTKELPFYIVADDADAILLYEQLFAHVKGVHFRYLDEFGDPVVVPAQPDCLEQIGFAEKEELLPRDKRIFRGFDLIREFYIFPQKFLGFRVTGLEKTFARLPAKSIDIFISFDEITPRLSAAVKQSMFSLYTAPAINLFEMNTDRITVRPNQQEYHVVPNKSRYLEYEPHQIKEVYAHYPGAKEKVPVYPLYSVPPYDAPTQNTLFFTMRRLPRRRTVGERKYGSSSDYTGMDMYLSLSENAGIDDDVSISEISVRALCTNRHLTEHLPVGEGGADFRFLENVNLEIKCVSGPTPPRGPLARAMRSRSESTFAGTITWRLINMLSLNQMGLLERGAGKGGESLREILSLFADLTDNAIERSIRGIRSVDSKPIVRRIRQRGGVGAARGLEVTVTASEKAFEGSGIFLLGAVLDRFFAEYVSLNSFTQTVIKTTERGVIKKWPPRIGVRREL